MSYETFLRWTNEPIGGEPDVSVVIPAYNEEQRIVPTVASIAAHLAETGRTWELIVADDGCADRTCEQLTELSLANLRIVGSGRNEGKGAAVRRGFAAARGRAVLFTDADMSTPIDELDAMLAALDDGADVVVGSRAADGATESERSGLRRLCSASLRLLVSVLLPTGVGDTQCGFKLFRREVAHAVVAQQRIDGFAFDMELLYLSRRAGLTIRELPVCWIDAPGSKVDPAREALRFLRDIPRIRRSARRGAPAVARSVVAARAATGARPPLHVAVVTPYPPSGRTLNEYGRHLVEAMADKPEVGRVVLLHDDAEVDDSTLPAGVDAQRTWAFGSMFSALRILRAVRRNRPDVVFFNIQFATFGAGRVSAALGLFAPAIVRAAGVPSVVLLHNLVDTVDLDQAGYASNRATNWLYRRIGEMLTRVILVADEVAVTIPAYVDILRDRYGASNVYLAPHGTFDPANGEPCAEGDGDSDRRRILAFGKFGTYKRVEDLVDAYRLLLTAGYDDLELVIAGTDAANTPGYLDGVAATTSDLPGVRFTGYVPEELVGTVFRSATLVAFPYTATTGSSGVLHQAGSYRCPVVLPEIGDFAEVVAEEGYAAETFEPGDAMSLAGALARLLDDDERRSAIGEQNLHAASAMSIADVVDWHVLHLERLAC